MGVFLTENSYIITSFYTKGIYEEIANEYLIPSIRKLGLESDIVGVEDLGSWQKNTSFKPSFALSMLEKHSDKNIVLLDVDSIVTKEPTLFNEIPEEFNIAAHILDWSTHYGHGTRKEFLSGSLFLRNNERVRMLVKYWVGECLYSSKWEQEVLADVLSTNDEPIYELPKSYTNIMSLPNGTKPLNFIEDGIINHFQKSRETRKVV